MATERPKLQIPLTGFDKVVEALCWGGLLALWVAAVLAYRYLPEIIPLHFNPAGKIDRYGDKVSVLFMPVIPTVLAIGLTFLNRYPHTFNYLEEITAANAERNYRMGTRLLRWTKLFMTLIFFSILFMIIKSASKSLSEGEITHFTNIIIAAVLLLPVLVLLILILQYRKNKHSHA